MKRTIAIAILVLTSAAAEAANPIMQGSVTWQGINIQNAVVSVDSTSCAATCTAQVAIYPDTVNGKARTNAAGQFPLTFTHVAGSDQNVEAQAALVAKYPTLTTVP